MLCSTGTACPLHIIGWAGRDITHIHGFQTAHINTHFESRRAAERIDLLLYEGFLIPCLLILCKLRRMLLDI